MKTGGISLKCTFAGFYESAVIYTYFTIYVLTSTLLRTIFLIHLQSTTCQFCFTFLGESELNAYFYSIMFVRKRKNRSGSTSVVVIDKSRGRFRELITIGVSSDEKVINELYVQGEKWIAARTGKRDMFLLNEQQREEKQVTGYFLN